MFPSLSDGLIAFARAGLISAHVALFLTHHAAWLLFVVSLLWTLEETVALCKQVHKKGKVEDEQ